MFNQLNRYGKNSAWAVAVLAMLLTGAGCSNDKNGSESSPASSVSASASASPSTSPEASPSSSAQPEGSAAASPTATPSGEQQEKESTGTYNGQIDNHSIEIESADGVRAYQIDDEISDKLSSWDDSIKVKFKYKINEIKGDNETIEQYVITSIDKQ
ncbi:hypothetical protein [Cohnella sp. JJ-181]|uniref:hypothetical protein n=1 Tax=Cohnella rhizoplanae TaxID=2974897 RepID=UPI0022FF612F|nr:hypothetical protein [Cohnella sp. JJ-181]CAI6079117.1 hypothetical protein COHCIP112018_02720 [Cohnella sp. JJ-181]